MNIINNIPQLEKDTWVSIDIEMFGMEDGKLHRPTSGDFACLTLAINDTDVLYVDKKKDLPEVFEPIDNCVWVLQKASFDIVQLRRWVDIKPRKKIWDTLLIDRILWNGYYDRFSLEHLARRYLGIEMDKSLQKSFATSTKMNQEQIEYACIDSIRTLQVARKQKEIMSKSDFLVWAKIDRPVMWAFLDFQGFAMDVDSWNDLARRNKKIADDIKAELPINPNSPKQVMEWFLDHKIRLKSTDEKQLLSVAYRKKTPEDVKSMIFKILDARKYGRRASTYGENFIEKYIEEENGVKFVYPSIDINRAETGRTASSDPNIQNIPVRETPEFRDGFIARPGNKLIIVDFSAQEPRITAYVTQDKRLIDLFISGDDPYIRMAKMFFNLVITKKDPMRAKMKAIILGMAYGLSKYGLSAQYDISIEESDELLKKAFTIFYGIDIWIKKQQKIKTYVKTVWGRKVWINPYTNQSQRNVLNAPIQGTASDMLKVSIARIHQGWKWDIPFGMVAEVHDEIILDVPENLAEEIRDFVVGAMVTVGEEMCPGIPFKVDAVIADRWSEKS